MATRLNVSEQGTTFVSQEVGQVSLTLSTLTKTVGLEIANAKISFTVANRNGEKSVRISISTDADISEQLETMSSTK
jgi:hypothetical protein